jgi:hypothetical protein
MNKLISLIAGLLTLIGGFHLYLNMTSDTEISLEKTLFILKANLTNSPVKTVTIILFILFISLLVFYLFDKFFSYIAYRERRREENIKKSLLEHSKRQENKELVFDRIIDHNITYLKSRENPWTRIKPEFHKIIVRDIRDKLFPELGDWYKSETFNLTKEGIEFFSSSNTSGFDLYFDEYYHWDAFHNNEKLKVGKYSKPQRYYCIDFLPYEDILHVDWEHDDYDGCITIFCQFKYTTNKIRHPFKEFRYYVLGDRFLTRLDDKERRNFKPLLWRIKHRSFRPIRRLKRYLKNKKYHRQQQNTRQVGF